MIIANISFAVEQTGGGCTAAVAYVEGGAVVVTDGNLACDFGWAAEQGEPIVAGWYPGTSWDDGDAAANAEGATPDAAVEALLAAIVRAGAMAHKIAVQKMGTRAGQPHYGVVCRGCSHVYGREQVLAVGHLSREGARALGEQHTRRV